MRAISVYIYPPPSADVMRLRLKFIYIQYKNIKGKDDIKKIS